MALWRIKMWTPVHRGAPPISRYTRVLRAAHGRVKSTLKFWKFQASAVKLIHSWIKWPHFANNIFKCIFLNKITEVVGGVYWFHSVRPSVRPLEEQIKDACIEVKTYDKRDAFKFEIINYPDLSGNIPTKPAYGVFTSQVIRYARICSK